MPYTFRYTSTSDSPTEVGNIYYCSKDVIPNGFIEEVQDVYFKCIENENPNQYKLKVIEPSVNGKSLSVGITVWVGKEHLIHMVRVRICPLDNVSLCGRCFAVLCEHRNIA